MFIDSQHLEQKPNFSQVKKELLEKRLHGRNAPTLGLSILKRPGDFAPLSPTQLRLWYLYQIDPEDSGYNYSTALLLTGKLDILVLQNCINEIVRRHEILRTTFAERDGQPVQIIGPELSIPLVTHDLSFLAKPQREAEYIRLAKDEGKKPFNLSDGPVQRVTLIRLDESEFVLLFTVHHIAYDGWSAGVLLKEFGIMYKAFVKGGVSPLPELPIQYADFAYWQHNKGLQGQLFEQQLAYWKQQLRGAPELLVLPSKRSRPVVVNYKGAMYPFTLSSELADRLRKASRLCDCTLFTFLLGAFAILLHRYSGENDICIGVPFAGRTKAELENLIGFFVNTLVIRTQIDNDSNFIGFIKKTQEIILDAQSNQDVPFDKIVEELKPQRNPGYNPIFQVMFVLHNAPLRSVDLPDLRLEKIELDYGVSKFDLVLHVTEKEGIELAFEYSTELFDPERIARLADYFKLITEVFTGDLNTRINDFALLTWQDHDELLQWNATERNFPQPQSLHNWFENHAQNHPQAMAVSCGQQTLSYNELDRRANQLAHWLRMQDVAAEARVGIYMERSIEMVVGILAVLKAGAAYVPINPNNPKERVSSLLADCGAQIVLTQERLLAGLPSRPVTVFCFDRDEEQLSTLPMHSLSFQQHGATAAYVIYTSGSTGSPKGVIVSHENALASTWARFDYYRQPLDGFLLASPIAFDSSVAGLFWTLSLGGRLCIPTEAELQDMDALTDLIAREKLSHLLCLPSFYGLILDYVGHKPIDNLRTVIVAGEACLPGVVAKHFANAPNIRLYNEYGPTEATVWSSVYEIQRANSVSSLPPAIGQPVTNSQIYLLDKHFNPVPIGVHGELCIGGAGLTRGYLGRPDLTAERFVPNPFNSVPGGRLYRTGDLARYRSDGNIEFLGRIDHQVKIRGFRIELREIESRFRQYPGIQDAVVIAHEDCVGNKRLVAYWVNMANSFPEVESMRIFLKETLPDYMTPAAFVRLDKLPLTTNGKLDRKALPDPDFNAQLEKQYVATLNEVEALLADIWRQILGLERIGVHDNFFALGGDSIMAIQMVGKARQLDLIFTPQQLFQHQTIAELAAVVGRVAHAQHSEQGAISGVAPLTPIQCWFFEQNLVNPNYWNQAILLELKAFIEPSLFEQAAVHLVAHHDTLRSRFSLDDGSWRQHTLLQEPNSVFHRIDLDGVEPAQQTVRIEAECNRWQASLHLTEGPLLRMVWFDLGVGNNPRLLLAIHHLLVDGVSWRILLEDLQSICRQLQQGVAVALPAKTTAFKHWAERLQQWAQSGDLQEQAAYWLRIIQSVVTPLPVDYPDGAREYRQTATVITELNEAETQALLREAAAAYRTEINDLLLAALAQTLPAWANAPDVLVDMEGHGRAELFDDVDLSRTVGWFTSVYPMRLNLPVDNHPGAVIKAVKEEIRSIPHKGIGYQVLRYLNRDASGAAFKTHVGSQVLFNYLGRLDRVLPEDALFDLACESAGQAQDADGLRSYELEINAHIAKEKLHVEWTYSAGRYRRQTIEALAASYSQALQVLIEHCLLPEAGGFTPSDFPLAGVGQLRLDSLISKFANHK